MKLADVTPIEIESYSRILMMLTRAGTRREARAGILQDLKVLMRADTVSSCSWDDDAARFAELSFYGGSPEIERLYHEVYQFNDPITFRMRAAARPVILDEVIDRASFRRTAFYNEFLKRDRLEWGMNLFAFDDDQRDLGDLRIWRRANKENFGQRETILLNALAPHFRATLQRLPRLGDPALSPRERDVCRLLSKGMTDKEIARLLGIGYATVRTHIGNAMAKTGTSNRAELAARMVTHLS